MIEISGYRLVTETLARYIGYYAIAGNVIRCILWQYL